MASENCPPPDDASELSVWARKPRTTSKRKPLRWRRVLAGLAAGGAVMLGLLWFAAHRVPWVGSALADGLRSVVGVEAVTALEDFAYGLQDRAALAWRGDEAPKAYWVVPPQIELPASTQVKGCELPTFRPADVGPVHAQFEAPGDGVWVPMDDRVDPGATPRMFKTLLHPDPKRSWAAVSLVAIDLRQVELHLRAGRHEPKASTAEGRRAERTGLIPRAHQTLLLAAFNGGFKAQHGHWGMMVDGVTLLPARKGACVVGQRDDGRVVIGPIADLEATLGEMRWWRQTPDCMLDDGELHVGLRSEKNTYWGATLKGETVIRRSAIGISADGQTLYSGIGDHTTARAIATAMKHAGAAHVAQLDVNWSYPKFVVYRDGSDGQPEATKLCEGFEFSPDEYVRLVASRDFFYLTRRDDETVKQLVCGD